MTREPESTAFDAIVAAWRAEGDVPQWPDDPPADRPGAGPDPDPDRHDAGPQPDPRGAGPHDVPPRVDRPGPARDADLPADPRADLPADPRADAPADARANPRADFPADPRADFPADPRADFPADPRADFPADPRADFPADPRADAPADFAAAAADGAADARADPRADPGAEDEGAADRHDAAGGDRSRPERSTRPAGTAADPLADEHFVPPEPPPLPRMGPPILVGLTLIGLGLVLVTFPGWVGVPQVYGLPLGLVAIAAGLGWLVLRLWPDPDDVPPPLYLDDPDDPDGGAVL